MDVISFSRLKFLKIKIRLQMTLPDLDFKKCEHCRKNMKNIWILKLVFV